MDDEEREGGRCVENGRVSEGGDGEDAERGVGSLTTFAMGGAMMGGESGEAGAGTEAGEGAEAVAVRVGRGVEVAAAAAVDTAPVSRETNLSETGLPEKNSPAVREGSIDGAGGKMSDWKVSD